MIPTNEGVNIVLFLSSYPPRECGIATFTQDLTLAMDRRFNPVTKTKIAAINEKSTSFYQYSSHVSNNIVAENLEDYVSLAERINKNSKVKLVNVQHEFGLFGGDWGDYLVPFIQVIKKPVVTTFHTVLSRPERELKKTVFLIHKHSEAIVVMNERSKELLKEQYKVSGSKLIVIPHGIPNTTFELPKGPKSALGLDGKTVIASFGLLSRDKGIQYVIKALPAVVRQYPNLLYLVLGVTHPSVRRHEGEKYRNYLLSLVDRLKLKDNVKFYNKYLELDEIIHYLKATDIYIAPNINPEQSVSGTLSYAMGCGRAVISTETEYAKYAVTPGTGELVKFKDPVSIKRALQRMLSDDKQLIEMHKQAYEETRKMIWPNVAAVYFSLYKKLAHFEYHEKKFPPIKFDHVLRMTDSFGLMHHARYSKPERRFGYSMDDNVRALILCVQYYAHDQSQKILELIKTYVRFIKFGQRNSGRFVNMISSHHRKERKTEPDTQGRAIWALGYALAQDHLPKEVRDDIDKMFHKAVKVADELYSPRAIAFAMTGLYHYLKRFSEPDIKKLFQRCANRQAGFYHATKTSEWKWFENRFTYSNSTLPESMYYANDLLGLKRYLKIAEESLSFLRSITYERKHYLPIGQNGWYHQNRKRSYFDQQPEDTASMVLTQIAVFKITKKKQHLTDAYWAYQWFLGKNNLKQMVYNEATGGCHDGVGKYSLNLNQGAESTIMHLLARLAFEDHHVAHSLRGKQ